MTRWLAFYAHSSKGVGLHLEIFSNSAKFLISSKAESVLWLVYVFIRSFQRGDCVTSQKNVCGGRLKQLLIRLCLLVWVLFNATFAFSIFCITGKSRSVRETKQQAFCYMTTIVAADDEERSFIFTSGFHCRVNMAAKEELQHSLFDLACAKVAEAHKLMNEARELVKQDLDNLKEEKTAFEKLSKTLDEVHFGSSVKLNVGGKVYKTTLDTLRKDPDSMLCAMFSGRHELKPDSEDGAYFIDRDGKLFRYIKHTWIYS